MIKIGDKSSAGSKYHESYGNCSKKVSGGGLELGAIVNHTPYSSDMDSSGSAKVFKINPELGALAILYKEDLLAIAEQISSRDCIPKNSPTDDWEDEV